MNPNTSGKHTRVDPNTSGKHTRVSPNISGKHTRVKSKTSGKHTWVTSNASGKHTWVNPNTSAGSSFANPKRFDKRLPPQWPRAYLQGSQSLKSPGQTTGMENLSPAPQENQLQMHEAHKTPPGFLKLRRSSRECMTDSKYLQGLCNPGQVIANAYSMRCAYSALVISYN